MLLTALILIKAEEPWCASHQVGHSTSALGQKQTSRSEIAMSALPPKADMTERDQDVCFVANSGH
jgi:hypothetical protein